ncbi:MAG TPA: SprB repeat-containing protein, partial [Bacteroidia bacterium]|nr:SprB repeat-containing protein [Bacteroidia bacterium]
YFYSYPIGKSSSINVNIFKKIVYHDIYPGIDIEYSFITGQPGIKYSLIVHPGADASVIKLRYSGTPNIKLNSNGDATMQTPVGEITDHAPDSYYQNSGTHIASSYMITAGNEESFSVSKNTSSTDNLVIDPWTTDPLFTAGYDYAYDVDYDNAGNVYAYGSYNPFQLTKFNSAGIQQWTFNAAAIQHTEYGDFATDKVSGTCYIVEGARFAGANVLKVNSLGALTSTFPGNAAMREMWRAEYNSCNHQIVIGGGGTNTPNTQACLLDTDMVTMTPVNPLGAVDGFHDVCLIAMDPTGNNAYMAIAQTTANTNFDNILMSLPIPALNPPNYTVPDKFGFLEVPGSINYLASGVTNGMNGMAASPNWLYMYNGDTIKKLNKATGAIIASKQVAPNPFQWGGLDADGCDNVYAGVNSSVKVYTSTFALTSTIALSNVVFDIVLGANYQTLYACGEGYVSSINLPTTSSISITNTITPTTCAGCNGSAKPTLLLCGAPPATTPTYLWTPSGQTTQTATGLCKGTYTCAISLGCGETFQDTVIIPSSGSAGLVLTPSQTNPKCFGGVGTATVTVTGGTGPYTYSWAPVGGTTSTAAALPVGTVTCTVNDAACHNDSVVITITAPPQLRDSISVTKNVKCFGGNSGSLTVGVKGGTPLYTYSWNTAPVQTTVTANNLTVGAYTVTVTDANGCSVTANTAITQPSQIRDSIVGTVAATCVGNNGSATVGVKDGTPGYTYSWNTAPIQTNATAIGVSPGTYVCTIIDANGCIATATATVTGAVGPRDSIVSTTNTTCFGGNNGSITLGVNRGTPGYSYSWNTVPGQTVQSPAGLSAGTYSVTVTDANGCVATATATV